MVVIVDTEDIRAEHWDAEEDDGEAKWFVKGGVFDVSDELMNQECKKDAVTKSSKQEEEAEE